MKHPDYPAHPVRPPQEQNVHDRVIQDLKQRLQRQGVKDVRVNPGQEKNHPIVCVSTKKQIWPDLFTVENNRVTWIYEVETMSTVDIGSADQWKDYAECIKNAKFVLVVPKEKENDAKRILTNRNIPYANVETYPA